MNGVISRGTKVRINNTQYTVDGLIAIDQGTMTYAISGDGPMRLFTVLPNVPVNALIEDDGENHYMDVEPFYHYIFDWDTGTVKENLAYGLVVHPNAREKDIRYILFSPYYMANISERQLGSVTRDYQLVMRESDIDEAVDRITEALISRMKYFTDKATSYNEALKRLKSMEF